MPFIVHNPVVFPWILLAISIWFPPQPCLPDHLPLPYTNRFQFGKKGLHGFDSDTFKILEVNKGLSLTTENSMGKGVDGKTCLSSAS